jgi:surface protein
MDAMFSNCQSLTSLDLSSFDTSKLTSLYGMFYGCTNLTTLDLSNFNTSNVENFNAMFYNCTSLTVLNLSSFDTSNVKKMNGMFNECSLLKTIILGENFKEITAEANLPNGNGWVNVNAPTKVISGDGDYAVIKNNGKNTYKLFGTVTPTYPTNIKVTYSPAYGQARLSWDKVVGADKYGIAVYLAGKWRIQTQNITTNSYTTPKNSMTPGSTYKVAVVARVNGKWDSENAIKHYVTITMPKIYEDTDGDGLLDYFDPKPNNKNNNGEIIPDLTAKKQYNAYVLNHTDKDSPLYENYLISGMDYKMSWEDFIDYYNEDSEFVFSISEANRTELRIKALQMCLEDLGYLDMNGNSYGCMGGSTKKAIIDFMLNYGFSVPELEFIEEDCLYDTDLYFFDIDNLTFQTIVNVAVNRGFDPFGDGSAEKAYNHICEWAGVTITKKYFSKIPRTEPILSDYQISQGIKIAEKDNIYTLDYTQPLNTIINEMRVYSEAVYEFDIENYTSTRYPIFFSEVNNGKEWDVKRINSWRTTIPNISYYTAQFEFKYRDYYMNAEDLGNYIYGYTGNAFGFALKELLDASNIVAFFGSTTDDENDIDWIKKGLMTMKTISNI